MSPVKCVSETEDDEEDEDETALDQEKYHSRKEIITEDQTVLRKKIDTLLGPKTNNNATHNNKHHPHLPQLTTATSTPSLARTWTCFGCGFRTKNSVTWHCINCERVSYLAPVYKETLPLRDRRKLKQRAARLRAKRSLSMDAAERHMVKCRKCTRDRNNPPPSSPTSIVFPWQERRRWTNKVSCVHQDKEQGEREEGGDLFGSPIKNTGKDTTPSCGVCGICELQSGQVKELNAILKTSKCPESNSEPRFTITTLARRATQTNNKGGKSYGWGEVSGREGSDKLENNLLGQEEDGGSGAGFLIAVKDWLLPSGRGGCAPRRPVRKLESGGGYQVIRKNLLNPRAQPVYNNEFHLTPKTTSGVGIALKEDPEEVDEVIGGVSDNKATAINPTGHGGSKDSSGGVGVGVIAGSEPVYAMVNKAAKTKNKNVAGERNTQKYSFLTDTLSRKQHQQQNVRTTAGGEEAGMVPLIPGKTGKRNKQHWSGQ